VLSAEASVPTDRAGRYLGQLCQHLERIAQAHPQAPVRVEWSGDAGLISMGAATCALRADEHTLTLRAEASDQASLQEIQRRVAERLEQIGRRDGLAVSWTTGSGGGGQHG
jgi:hypothetical protein